MKRSLSLVLVLALALSLFAVSVSAAETKTSLIPAEGATWVKTDHGEGSVNVEYKDGAVVFSGSVPGTWPCTESWYIDNPIVADTTDDYLSIDFTVVGGTTNINFFFDDGNGGSIGYSISNTALNEACPGAPIDEGSGDLYDGEYKCTISIADLVASVKNLKDNGNDVPFPAGAVIDGQVKFIGINVYSVNGATITINDLSVVNVGEDAPVEPDEPDEPENPGTPVIGNLVAGLEYVISEQFRAGADYGWDENAPVSYPDDNYELTDGKLPNPEDGYSAAEWMGFNNNTPVQTERGYAYVQFDLGEAKALSSVTAVSFKDKASGIACPYKVEVYVSNDGTNYESAGILEYTTDDLDAMEDKVLHNLKIDVDTTAQYIELRFTSYGWCFLGEIEVLGETDATDAPSKPVVPGGDAGILVFAVLAVVAIAGCAVTVKSRG